MERIWLGNAIAVTDAPYQMARQKLMGAHDMNSNAVAAAVGLVLSMSRKGQLRSRAFRPTPPYLKGIGVGFTQWKFLSWSGDR